MVDHAPPAASRRSRSRLVVQGLLSLLVVAIFYYLRRKSDAEVSWAEVLAVFAFARLATAIPLTPGGVGLGPQLPAEARRP